MISFNKITSTSYLLTINTVKILLNIGNIDDITEPYDAVLITNFDYKYINSLRKMKTMANVFMTVPTFCLGKIVIKELYSNRFVKDGYDEELRSNYLAEEEIESIFSTFTQLKYSQPHDVAENLTITAFRSGFSLGNSIWKIKKDEEVILVCFDINHKKENHVDGLDIETFKDVTLCILQAYNNQHSVAPAKTPDRAIKDSIIENERVFIFVSYVRLLEMCYLLNDILIEVDRKGFVLSNYGLSFLEAARGMTEWAGERVIKDFSRDKDKPFRFDRIRFVDTFDEKNNIVIVVDEGVNNFHSSMLYHKYKDCDKTAMLFFGNNKFLNKETLTLNVPELLSLCDEEFETLKKEMEAQRKKLEEDRIITEYLQTKVEESEDEVYSGDKDIARKMFWYQYKHDLWITDEVEKYASFPEVKTLRFDEYGEKFIFKGKIEVDPVNRLEDVVPEDVGNDTETIPTTKIVWHTEEITLNTKTSFFELHGHSDFESIINILELTRPSKVIFFGDEEPANYYYYYFSFNPNFNNVYVLKDELNLNIDDKNYQYLTVNEDFYASVDFKKIDSAFYSAFVGKIENSSLTFVEKCRPFLIGSLKVYELKKKFIGEGLRVEVNNNVLMVEDAVEIVFNNENDIELHGEINDLYMSVRNILYKEMAFL